MPTYDYECTGCGHRHQIKHAMSADTPDCPDCSSALRQIFLTAPALSGVKGGSGISVEHAPCEAPGGGCATGACPFVS